MLVMSREMTLMTGRRRSKDDRIQNTLAQLWGTWEVLSTKKCNFFRESVLAGLAAAFSPAVDESFISSVRQKIDKIHSPTAFV
jgi:hypothetical protein